MKPKKILYVITKSNWGGAQRYVFDLATTMKECGFDVAVACGDSRNTEGGLPGLLVQGLEKSGIRVILVPSFARDISIMKEFSVFKELKEIFKENHPDILHLNSSKAGGIGALAAHLVGIKNIIFTSHGLSWDEDRNTLSRALIFISSYATFLLCHKVILITKNNFDRVKNLPFCKKRMFLIQNGIAPIDFKSQEDARTIIGKPIKDTPWIGTTAEFTRNKGLSYLVEAASLLKKNGFTFRMSLAGDGEDLRKIKKQAEESGLYNTPRSRAYIDLLNFPGFEINVARNLKAFEIFVLASVKEGLPYVLLEAGQAGLAVVASKVGGIPDIIEDGVTGTLVNPKNPEEIKDALAKYIRDPNLAKQHGEALKNKIQKEFSIEKMLAETKKLYEV